MISLPKSNLFQGAFLSLLVPVITEACLDEWTLKITGKNRCSLSTFISEAETQDIFGSCNNTEVTDVLKNIYEVENFDELSENFDKLCESAYDNESTFDFEGVSGRGSAFDNEYFSGGTFYNEERQDIDEYKVATMQLYADPGARIKNIYDYKAQDKKFSWPHQDITHMQDCELNSIMCCWTQDRQANDNNGNCGTPYPKNCVDKNPADNTDVCFVDSEKSGSIFVYRDNAEDDSHCHGTAWSEDKRHVSARFAANNLFYISQYDHLYKRGYVRNVPGAPMCSCVERMPIATRSDCTQVDLLSEDILFSYSKTFGLKADVSNVKVKFNACQGANNQNNDLRAYHERLRDEGQISETQSDLFEKRLVGKNNCPSEINSFLKEKGYEPMGSVVLTNYQTKDRIFAQKGKKFEGGFGVFSKTLYNDQKWQLRPQPYNKCYGKAEECYLIVNAISGRRLYAQSDKTGSSGVGATPPNYPRYADQHWRLEHTPCGEKMCYLLINIYSDRCLQIQNGRVAAFSADDQKGFNYSLWTIDGNLDFNLESVQAITPSPTSAPTGLPTVSIPEDLFDVPIRNFKNGRKMYAQLNQKWEKGVGAGANNLPIYQDNKWRFQPVACPSDYDTESSSCYFILNMYSNRILYAHNGKNWEKGLGAGPGSMKHKDNYWDLIETDCGEMDKCYFIKNTLSGRYLYSTNSGQWDKGVGALSTLSSLSDGDARWILK
uniref:Ricin B lectin domain-containing protein n=1 Tax=Corethron hystrix TaxID=216773 RepID=A0A7S1BU42_9STRA|mmetsp:Transcript_4110/g.7940  ORF Transcript_4110/g.7940 Transcript_4110/m.7940 type:complete len:718 (+) Transcript_4110:149-2302(+)